MILIDDGLMAAGATGTKRISKSTGDLIWPFSIGLKTRTDGPPGLASSAELGAPCKVFLVGPISSDCCKAFLGTSDSSPSTALWDRCKAFLAASISSAVISHSALPSAGTENDKVKVEAAARSTSRR